MLLLWLNVERQAIYSSLKPRKKFTHYNKFELASLVKIALASPSVKGVYMFTSLLNLSDLFSFNTFFAEGDGGGTAGNPAKTEDDDKNKTGNNEEKITLTRAELEEKLNNKFAEGARKAQQGKLDNNPAEPNKTSTGEVNTQKQPDNTGDISAIKEELKALKAEKTVRSFGVKDSYAEDLIALVRGKGLELTEDNLKKEADKHPEWKTSSDEDTSSGAKPLGSTSGKTTPPAVDEEANVRKMFGL